MPVAPLNTHLLTLERLEIYGQGALKPWGYGKQQMLSYGWAHTLTPGPPQLWSGMARLFESCQRGKVGAYLASRGLLCVSNNSEMKIT